MGRIGSYFQRVAFAGELSINLLIFILFISSYPDRYRSLLWATGGGQGWNSDPALRIYFYANHKEPPEIPWIWTQRPTDANLATAIIAITICLAKGILYLLQRNMEAMMVFYDVLLSVMWALCISNQLSSDYSDPDHPSPCPWYLRKSCRAVEGQERTACIISQVSFGISFFLLLLHLLQTILRIARSSYRLGENHAMKHLSATAISEMEYRDIECEENWASCSTLEDEYQWATGTRNGPCIAVSPRK